MKKVNTTRVIVIGLALVIVLGIWYILPKPIPGDAITVRNAVWSTDKNHCHLREGSKISKGEQLHSGFFEVYVYHVPRDGTFKPCEVGYYIELSPRDYEHVQKRVLTPRS